MLDFLGILVISSSYSEIESIEHIYITERLSSSSSYK